MEENENEKTVKPIDRLFNLSASCYNSKLAYQEASRAWRHRETKKAAALKTWEENWDAADPEFDNFTFYVSLAQSVPPTREKDYRLKIKALASKTTDPEESLKICKGSAPFLANIAERPNFIRWGEDFHGYNDLSPEEIQELEEIFDEEWLKRNPEDLSKFMFCAPPSRKHLVVAEISRLYNLSAEENLNLAIIKECAGSARSFLSAEDAKKVLDSWYDASLVFFTRTSDPIIMANNAEYLATEPDDYSKRAINFASSVIEMEKDDTLVLEALEKINLPRCLNINAWRRFYQTAKNREDVYMIIGRLNSHNKIAIGRGSILRDWTEKKELILPAFCDFVAEEILATKDFATAMAVLEKFSDAIKLTSVYEHLLWLYISQQNKGPVYDPDDDNKRREQDRKKSEKDLSSGRSLLAIATKTFGKKSVQANLVINEVTIALEEVSSNYEIDELRELVYSGEFFGQTQRVLEKNYRCRIVKKHTRPN